MIRFRKYKQKVEGYIKGKTDTSILISNEAYSNLLGSVRTSVSKLSVTSYQSCSVSNELGIDNTLKSTILQNRTTDCVIRSLNWNPD